MSELRHPVATTLAAVDGERERTSLQQLAIAQGHSEDFVVATQRVEPIPGTRFKVIALAPMSDFTGPIESARRDVMLTSLLMLALLLLLAMLGSQQLVAALGGLQLARAPLQGGTLQFDVQRQLRVEFRRGRRRLPAVGLGQAQ